MAILESVRVLLLILIFSVSIRVSTSCQKKQPPNFNPGYAPDRNEYLDLVRLITCEKLDKHEDCSNRGMHYYQHPVKGCESLGFCDCYNGRRSEDPCEDYPIRKQIYAPEEDGCYPVFSKGPCKQREWLIFDEQESIWRCVKNPCFPRGSNLYDFWFYDPQIGQCHQAYTQGYCPKDELLLAVHDSPYPQCSKVGSKAGCRYGTGHSSGIKSYLECRPGTRYSHFLKQCRGSLGIARVG